MPAVFKLLFGYGLQTQVLFEASLSDSEFFLLLKTSRPGTRLIYFPMTNARKNIMEDYTVQILDIFSVAEFSFLNKRSLTEQILKNCEEHNEAVLLHLLMVNYDRTEDVYEFTHGVYFVNNS